ncbi:MAG: hypothetical protein QXQ64_06375, partial [Candidatus Bathyarchaeia archaeon]
MSVTSLDPKVSDLKESLAAQMISAPAKKAIGLAPSLLSSLENLSPMVKSLRSLLNLSGGEGSGAVGALFSLTEVVWPGPTSTTISGINVLN